MLLPQDICAKSYGGFMLVISPSAGKWIVLESQCQVEIFKSFMNGLTEEQTAKIFSNAPDEIAKVAAKIEGMNFTRSVLPAENAFTLRLYLTNKCNLRCAHCFMNASDALDDELSYDEICLLLNKCRASGCVKVILTGGEVMTRRDFGDIVRYSASLGMYVQVLTNGTLWNEDSVNELAPYIDEIQVSIDGFNEESNAEIRGKNTFVPAMNTLELFLAHSDVLSSAVITPTYDALSSFRKQYTEFARSLTEKYHGKNFLVIIQNELIDGRNIKADPLRNKIMTETVNAIYEEIYGNSELASFIMSHRDGKIFRNCGWGNLTISADGNIYFCGRINDLKSCGNVRTSDFDSVMTLRESVREYSSVDYVMPCRECEIRYICGGGCRVKNFPDIVKSDPKLIPYESFTRRTECNVSDKEKFYRLMIESEPFLIER